MVERRRKPDYVHGNRTWENTGGYFKHKNEGSKEMNQNETQWDKLLKIKTTGRDDSHSDQYRYPYEPTVLYGIGAPGKQWTDQEK